ncbi:ModD protein [Clostridium tyrobutyricum]|uniref:Putative pyrophosphorylase ModD n=1 Tax=Clostridium tyrobutyricum DIVETGP TaxID=1408889 RepID=W6N5W6_CLOTY|nr:ModD protein [Clostridium tyrobutyricum]AND85955.1 putative nicotinate-nucleotide diphosphorylase [Clostridium tyrobutyricum]ANP70461.1 ModD protein [Clostridium tyrobutyricum]MBV4434973.1 ModD protein [Clostridium tyrobutyricum]QNB67908.1 ModD protein [Clostridium tyrobutyricum]CDL92003.1 Molybdenum transport system protein ModD [Clostridium tyrobutyricum DIVETGP]
MYISDETLDKFIKEDVPYIDLTSLVLEIKGIRGNIKFFTREDAILCGAEEAARIFRKLNIDVINSKTSGTQVKKGDILLEGMGDVENLHIAWKVCQNIIDNFSGIATKTRRIIDEVSSVNPDITVITTRKSMPGTRELSTKAVIAGGVFPHRLGLSETILVFKQHLDFLGGIKEFIKNIERFKNKVCEKKILVEVENIDDAVKLCKNNIDGIQFDKLSPEDLISNVNILRNINPDIVVLAAGGINENNAAKYAKTGVNGIVTSSVYYTKPIDIGCKIKPLH